jgi:hypothetical protein
MAGLINADLAAAGQCELREHASYNGCSSGALSPLRRAD